MLSNMRILAVGAHPDDIELGCGGSLAKLSAAGANIRAVVFSKGRRGVLSESDRAAETQKALQQIGVHDIRVCDFEDTRLSASLNDMVAVLEDVAGNIVLAVIRGMDHTANQRKAHLPAVSMGREEQRDLRRQARKNVRIMRQGDQRCALRDLRDCFVDVLRTRPKIRKTDHP